jgi:hypothetical protein
MILWIAALRLLQLWLNRFRNVPDLPLARLSMLV